MNKIISFRANDEDLKMIDDLTKYLEEAWNNAGVHQKATRTDAIFQAIFNDWHKKCKTSNN